VGGLLTGRHVLQPQLLALVLLGQPFDLPERLLAGDPEKTLFRGGSDALAPEAMEEYVRCLRDPEAIHATCEDYRAAATLDYEHDAEDREASRRIACPVLAFQVDVLRPYPCRL